MSHEQCPNLCKFSEEVAADVMDAGAPDWNSLLEFIMELITIITNNCPAKASVIVQNARAPQLFQRVKVRAEAWRMAKASGLPLLRTNYRRIADCCCEHAADKDCCTDEELAALVRETKNDNWVVI